MMYLVATASSLLGTSKDVGVIVGPRSGGLRPLKEGRLWASDCDAFHGKFDQERFIKHLKRLRPYQSTCLFAVAPDVFGDARATLKAFGYWGPWLRDQGLTPAYVCHVGSEKLAFPEGVGSIFLGSPDTWRGQHLMTLTHRAKAQNLHVHVGRVNSARRLRDCAAAGVDSADGTYLSFAGVERGVNDVQRWLSGANAQDALFSAPPPWPLPWPPSILKTRPANPS